MPDGTSRFSCSGGDLFHYMGCSTFSNFTVLPEIALAKVREDAPFDKICYIGCGVTPGIGAVVYTAKVWPGANVAVFGLGGIGLNVIQAARMVGADKIVGIDLNPDKVEMARRFGMTDFVNPGEIGSERAANSGAPCSPPCDRGGLSARFSGGWNRHPASIQETPLATRVLVWTVVVARRPSPASRRRFKMNSAST